ncbi:MAG: SDR family NAD(P)-dependent oxidoreductase [Muribaculum sp.]|nr:SDR family NAD(P)-dependent oxidoreductase [Muribaculum sp.]
MNILIIGATSGIGHNLWEHYVSSGHNVIVVGRRKELLDDMAQDFPENTHAVSYDISQTGSFDNELGNIIREYGRIDLAVICAGIGELNPKLDVETELSTLSVNVMGWANAVASVYRLFEEQKSGHLVTVTSVGGLQPTPIAPSYSASKAFQINYTKSLQGKAKGTDIVITEIRPGLVDTRMAKGEGLFWVMPLDKVCRKIIKAVDKKQKRLIVTRRWRIINCLLKHFA